MNSYTSCINMLFPHVCPPLSVHVFPHPSLSLSVSLSLFLLRSNDTSPKTGHQTHPNTLTVSPLLSNTVRTLGDHLRRRLAVHNGALNGPCSSHSGGSRIAVLASLTIKTLFPQGQSGRSLLPESFPSDSWFSSLLGLPIRPLTWTLPSLINTMKCKHSAH